MDCFVPIPQPNVYRNAVYFPTMHEKDKYKHYGIFLLSSGVDN
jgi:hypothetical protein